MRPTKVFPFDEWSTFIIRVSIFIDSSIDLSNEVSWETLFDSVPDNQNTQPKIGLKESIGEFEGGKLILRTRPGRGDLIYQYQPVDENEVKIDDQVNALDSFIIKADMILKKYESLSDIKITRLAFGAELHLYKQERKDAYNALDQLLHNVKVDPGSFDFEYRINRKRPSKAESQIEINRLSQWSALELKVDIGQGGFQTHQIHKSYACRLILDINTVPAGQVILPNKKLRLIFKELVEFGKEIAENGDIE